MTERLPSKLRAFDRSLSVPPMIPSSSTSSIAEVTASGLNHHQTNERQESRQDNFVSAQSNIPHIRHTMPVLRRGVSAENQDWNKLNDSSISA